MSVRSAASAWVSARRLGQRGAEQRSKPAPLPEYLPGPTKIAGGGFRPMRCSAANTSPISPLRACQGTPNRLFIDLEGGEPLLGRRQAAARCRACDPRLRRGRPVQLGAIFPNGRDFRVKFGAIGGVVPKLLSRSLQVRPGASGARRGARTRRRSDPRSAGACEASCAWRHPGADGQQRGAKTKGGYAIRHSPR